MGKAFLVLLMVGCYSPAVPDKGFTCDPADEPHACPEGMLCVNNYCRDPLTLRFEGSDLGSQRDMAVPVTPGDLASSGSTDLAQQQNSDMACGAQGSMCSKASQCCSNLCFVLCL
jgi:hypothetical protein